MPLELEESCSGGLVEESHCNLRPQAAQTYFRNAGSGIA